MIKIYSPLIINWRPILDYHCTISAAFFKNVLTGLHSPLLVTCLGHFTDDFLPVKAGNTLKLHTKTLNKNSTTISALNSSAVKCRHLMLSLALSSKLHQRFRPTWTLAETFHGRCGGRLVCNYLRLFVELGFFSDFHFCCSFLFSVPLPDQRARSCGDVVSADKWPVRDYPRYLHNYHSSLFLPFILTETPIADKWESFQWSWSLYTWKAAISTLPLAVNLSTSRA